MKTQVVVAAVGVLSLSIPVFGADRSTCKNAATKFADYVVKVRTTLPPGDRERYLTDQARTAEFGTVGQKMGARADRLVDTSLSKSEVQTELFGYCMNL